MALNEAVLEMEAEGVDDAQEGFYTLARLALAGKALAEAVRAVDDMIDAPDGLERIADGWLALSDALKAWDALS